ncbi:hypothetical protein OIU84_000095 [Salix udensis]|uniref:Uncharacterized protein n=1 Tax=Salix udensis TaxID=889485 RepID=A0AAD6PNH5_9ROSI|nr:hypothetical protein OIU84_000095 [Salix udensis]
MSSKSLISMVIYGFLLLSLCNSLKDKAVDGTRTYFHTLKINSLPSTDVCKESSKAPTEGSSLKLVHKFGQCNPHRTSTAPASSFTGILRRDKLRVDSII